MILLKNRFIVYLLQWCRKGRGGLDSPLPPIMFLGTIHARMWFFPIITWKLQIVFEPTHTATSYYTTPQYCIMYRECCHMLPDWSACKWNTAWYLYTWTISCKSRTPLCKSKTNQPPPAKYPVWNPGGVYKTIKTNAYVNQINQTKKHCVHVWVHVCVCVHQEKHNHLHKRGLRTSPLL